MSNDLISRSAFIKAIHDFVEQHRNDDEVQWTGHDWLLKEDSVIGIINNLSTAYDVDKVVNQIRQIPENYSDNDIASMIDDAIEFVKSGGIE